VNAYEIAMPPATSKVPATVAGAVLERLAVICETQARVPVLGGRHDSVAFTGALGAVVAVPVSDFFDRALADTLRAVDETGMAAAFRALHDAESELTQVSKAHHRQIARNMARVAFDGYESTLSERKTKVFVLIGEKDVAIHYRAVEAASAIAALCWEARDTTAVKTWIDHATRHLARAATLVSRDGEVAVGHYHRKYGKGVTASKVFGLFDPYPADTHRTARMDAERALAATAGMELNQERFVRLGRMLLTPRAAG
jgi:hypothetical protein